MRNIIAVTIITYMRNFFGILFDQPCSMLRIFIIFKSILTKDDLIILHNIIVPNTKGPFSLVLIIHIIYNIINLSIFKLKFHKTIIIYKCVYTCCACEDCVCARSVCAASVRRHFLYFFVYFLEKLKLFIRLKIFIWIYRNFNIILKCIICCPSIKHFLLNIIIIIIYLSYNHKVINYHQLNYWFRISLKYTTFLYHHD